MRQYYLPKDYSYNICRTDLLLGGLEIHGRLKGLLAISNNSLHVIHLGLSDLQADPLRVPFNLLNISAARSLPPFPSSAFPISIVDRLPTHAAIVGDGAAVNTNLLLLSWDTRITSTKLLHMT